MNEPWIKKFGTKHKLSLRCRDCICGLVRWVSTTSWQTDPTSLIPWRYRVPGRIQCYSGVGTTTSLTVSYTLCLKNIPVIIVCNVKKDYPISIIFGTRIPKTTQHRMNVQIATLPNVCFCTTWEKQNKRNMCWNEQNKSANSISLPTSRTCFDIWRARNAEY